MSEFLIRNDQGFSLGYNVITKIGEVPHDTGIEFGILKLEAGEEYPINNDLESTYLLIHGQCVFSFADQKKMANRESCFDEDPYALHLAKDQTASIKALKDCEFAVAKVANENLFLPEFFSHENMLESEHRGKGLLNDTAYRLVRTIFDIRNRPHAKLVLGEVVTAPGKWSSYPPHHHAQPEIYHYRFTEPQGYGHAECGHHVFKVKQFDTYKILNMRDHAQTAAPGYGMYYIWVIRHLADHAYDKPTFAPEHVWTSKVDANEKVWKGKFS